MLGLTTQAIFLRVEVRLITSEMCNGKFKFCLDWRQSKKTKIKTRDTLISSIPAAFYDVCELNVPRAYAAGLELLCVTFDFRMNLDGPAFAVLSDEERASAARFLRHEDAIRFATTRVVLRHALAKRSDLAAGGLQLQRDEVGRPRLASTKDHMRIPLDFNVSHSGQHALIALATGRRVGVDIEARRSDLNWEMLSTAVLAPHDEAQVAALPAHLRIEAFYDVWTAKEALLKALGIGIGSGMTWFSVLGGKDGEPLVRVSSEQTRGGCLLTAFDAAWCVVPAGYAACVAWSRDDIVNL
ncbi:4'-phosphopantetheinyl transferase family protein [Thiomonas intermedia]|uniref:4'-phosphopantetheinyl transferase family protein n=1 Tax=Thiomonas intermedia TaxID=926 RepID=UPI001FE6C08B|nr:4'-phosphopantetheinyl transferase superfamily protein [Thiomonas intermedia]